MTSKGGSVRLNLDEELRALTESPSTSRAGGIKRKFTFSLLFCCFTMGMASFQFGLAISSLNSVTQPVKTFTRNELILFQQIPVEQDANSTETDDAATTETTTLFHKYRPMLKKFYIDVDEDGLVDLIFTVTNCLFVLGGMLGSVTSKYVLDGLGRKKGTLFHNLFSVIGAALIILAYYFKSPFTAMFSRFFFGIQSGMSCTLVPTYMNEVSPSNLRGQTGIVHQLFINFGIILGQLLGFKQILGTDSLWHFLLALPLIPAILNFFLLLLFFPETPRELFLTHRDVGNARRALQLLRNDLDVNDELQEIYKESTKSEDNEKTTLGKLFTKSSLRWPLITSLVLQMSQQFCGVNAIFYYSSGIFEKANIKPEYIQYAILGTGLVNALTTIIAIPLIDRVGRRLLLIIPIALIILDFIALTAFLKFQESFWYFPYLSIACILLFLCCFGFSLGPIPFLYTAEVFPQSARNTAMAVANLTNWFSGFILTLAFPFLLNLINQYVFLIFSGFLTFALAVIITKVPETNGKSPEQIAAIFQKKK